MAKIGKLTKFLKKINSFGNKLSRSNSNVSSSDSAVTDGSARLGSDRLQTVYVGRSRREYRVDPDLLGHPAVQDLVDRSDGSDQITVGCEVVLRKMAKFGKLTKLRCALKKINSFKLSRSNSSLSSTATDGGAGIGAETLQTVYVGRSRREYRVDPDLLEHPAVQELVGRSDGSDQITVGCEAVLFDHLRWMIQNSDPQTSPLDDLAELYAY
ncbi:hypothetical protein V2J09_003064 [Rumex salicifolius]